MNAPEIAVVVSSIVLVLTMVTAAFSLPRWVENKLDKMISGLDSKFMVINTELKEIHGKLSDLRDQITSLGAKAVTKDECRAEHRRVDDEISLFRGKGK